MCEYRTNEKLLDFVLSPIINHSSKETKVFKGKEYFINKMITECENFVFYFERYEYNEFFVELKLCMKPYAYVSKRTTMMHFCYLAIMVAFVVKLDDTDEYKNLFVNLKVLTGYFTHSKLISSLLRLSYYILSIGILMLLQITN